MKLYIEEVDDCQETQIQIRCRKINTEVQTIINLIKKSSQTILSEQDGAQYQVSVMDIQYFISIDDVTYLYTSTNTYRCDTKLYVLERDLQASTFIRISKSCLANIHHMVHVTPLFDGKFEALMENNETLVINRHYVKAFKEAFGL